MSGSLLSEDSNNPRARAVGSQKRSTTSGPALGEKQGARSSFSSGLRRIGLLPRRRWYHYVLYACVGLCVVPVIVLLESFLHAAGGHGGDPSWDHVPLASVLHGLWTSVFSDSAYAEQKIEQVLIGGSAQYVVRTKRGTHSGRVDADAKWVTYGDCKLVDVPADRRARRMAGEALGLKLNDPDGDSFPVECHAMLASTEPDDIHSGGEFLKELRLYSVDAPESAFKTYGRGESNKARIDDQAVYFGLPFDATTNIGQRAKAFTLEFMKRHPSFQVHTRGESVYNDQHRVYGLVSTGLAAPTQDNEAETFYVDTHQLADDVPADEGGAVPSGRSAAAAAGADVRGQIFLHEALVQNGLVRLRQTKPAPYFGSLLAVHGLAKPFPTADQAAQASRAGGADDLVKGHLGRLEAGAKSGGRGAWGEGRR